MHTNNEDAMNSFMQEHSYNSILTVDTRCTNNFDYF